MIYLFWWIIFFFLMIKSIFLNSKLFLKIIKPINRLNKKYHLIYTISNLTFIHVHSSREILQFFFLNLLLNFKNKLWNIIFKFLMVKQKLKTKIQPNIDQVIWMNLWKIAPKKELNKRISWKSIHVPSLSDISSHILFGCWENLLMSKSSPSFFSTINSHLP